MNEGKRPKSFSSVLLFRFSLFDEGISSFSFLFSMATFQFLFRYSFFCEFAAALALYVEDESLLLAKKHLLLKLLDFFKFLWP